MSSRFTRVSCVVLLALNVFAIAILWWNGSSTYFFSPVAGGLLIAFGRLAGLLAEMALLFELVLVGRIRFLENAFGFPNMNRLHRTVGGWLVSLIIFHPLLLTLGYAASFHHTYLGQFSSFLSEWEDVFLALIGLLLILVAGALSARFARSRMKYEYWHGIHLFMYLGVALAFLHQLQSGDMITSAIAARYWIGLHIVLVGAVVLYRFCRPLVLFQKHRFVIDQVIHETPDVTSLVIRGRNIGSFAFKPGQYASIIVLSKKCWTPHPFSFSAAPNGDSLRFSIKGLGDYTKAIANVKPGTKIIIDGPMGVFTPDHASTNKYVCIAGGIGITPIFAMLQDLQKKNADVVLLYASAEESTMLFRDDIRKLASAWPNFRYAFYVAKADEGASLDIKQGYVDEQAIVSLAPDVAMRDDFICGPPGMITSLEKTLDHLHVPRKQIHHEKFAF